MRSFLTLSFIFLSHFVTAQNFFEKIFYNQHGTACAKEDSVGNIIVAFPDDSTITKYDSLMNPIWSKTYDFHTYHFEILNNGNWICGGYKNTGSGAVPLMCMLDSNGDTIWTRTQGTSASVPNSSGLMKMDQSGNFYFLTGPISNQWISPNHFYKLDYMGNLLGDTALNLNVNNNFHFNIIGSNKLVTAFSHPIFPTWSCAVDEYDLSFNHLWSSLILDTIGNPHTYDGGVVFPSQTGNIVVGGRYDWYMQLFHLNSGGNIVSVDNCQGAGSFIDVIPVPTGGYLSIGFYPSSNTGWATRFGSNFSQLWYVEFTGIQGIYCRFLQEAHDGFIISGSTVNSSGYKIPWMTKLDFNGSISTSIKDVIDPKLFQINYTNHKVDITQSGGNKLIIYDINGRVVKIIENLIDKSSIDFFEKPGVYVFSLYKFNEIIDSKKLVVD